jgi:hypothetical protein
VRIIQVDVIAFAWPLFWQYLASASSVLKTGRQHTPKRRLCGVRYRSSQ